MQTFWFNVDKLDYFVWLNCIDKVLTRMHRWPKFYLKQSKKNNNNDNIYLYIYIYIYIYIVLLK